MMDNNIP